MNNGKTTQKLSTFAWNCIFVFDIYVLTLNLILKPYQKVLFLSFVPPVALILLFALPSFFFFNFSSFLLCSNIAWSRHFMSVINHIILIIMYFSSVVLSEYVYKKKERRTDLIINYSNFNYFYYLIIYLNIRTNNRPKFNYCFILFCFKIFVLEKITLRQKGGFSLDTAVILTTFPLRQFFIVFKRDD